MGDTSMVEPRHITSGSCRCSVPARAHLTIVDPLPPPGGVTDHALLAQPNSAGWKVTVTVAAALAPGASTTWVGLTTRESGPRRVGLMLTVP